MYAKGKLALKPHDIQGRDEVEKIFKRFQESKASRAEEPGRRSGGREDQIADTEDFRLHGKSPSSGGAIHHMGSMGRNDLSSSLATSTSTSFSQDIHSLVVWRFFHLQSFILNSSPLHVHRG